MTGLGGEKLSLHPTSETEAVRQPCIDAKSIAGFRKELKEVKGYRLMGKLKSRLSGVALGMLGTIAGSAAGAQESGIDGLSPATRAEVLNNLSPATRAEVMRLVQTPPAAPASASVVAVAPAPAENDFLCTEFGCAGGSLYAGLNSWRTAAQNRAPNSNGGVVGFDIAAPVPYLAAYGIGVQAGSTFGLYDWSGNAAGTNGGSHQRQSLYTIGAFRQPDFHGPWWQRFGAGFAYDYSSNSELGLSRSTVNLRQWRGKLAFELTDHQEIGASGSWHSGEATGGKAPSEVFRAASQISMYYKYTFDNNADVQFSWAPGETSTISNYANTGYHYGYHDVIGVGAQVPLNEYFALFANGTYAFENDGAAPIGNPARSDAFTSFFGIKFFWGGDAATPAWQRKHWEPFLPNPDSGNFLIDGGPGRFLPG